MHIIVVGGGAGGLELATRLGRKLGRRKKAEITLVDRNQTHIWKPLLHEVATGSLDTGTDEISYRAHAHNHHFRFVLGSLSQVDREARTITLSALTSSEGQEILPERTLSYDYLVLAIGSVSNDFGIEGIAQHCMYLDSPQQAERFRQRLVNGFLRLNQQLETDPQARLRIAIVGGGATGVELAAELFNAAELFKVYGLEKVTLDHLQITLLEAGTRILPALPPRIAASARDELAKLGVDIREGAQIVKAEKGVMHTQTCDQIHADLMVWAAGIKAPDFLRDIEGLELSRNNQIVVTPSLQVSNDPHLYVLGDCAACPLPDGGWVPPRAQSAHQMATLVYKNLVACLSGKPQKPFKYKDHGSLISLSHYSTVGSLMGNLTRGSMMIEGRIARVVYISLYRMHQLALHGWIRTILMTVVERVNRILKPRLKLH
ncbi:NAD(P)/FAD-dependent oxidoreductase [Nitrincola alkalilacustris]|uniref:NAD(P)/FAD-dependent oxidoreductase n=1 Tax=Nitrincola alkalilacustris TaxID=1571224 RepID=UPI00124E362C|nr:NAD(P)/FAD-dependent oxidoreductase [Nitrincola alkalilacustris]